MPLGLSLACRPDAGAGLNANGSAGGDERVWIDDHGCFFFRNRAYISHKFLIVYIVKLTKTLLKDKRITIKSL
jgi:hypothetical protein